MGFFKFYIFVLGILLSNSSSAQSEKSHKLNDILADKKTCKFSKEIPVSKYSGNLLSSYYSVRRYEKEALLPSIEQGVDSFEIRFWYGHVKEDSLQCVRIYYTENAWHGALNTTFYKRGKSEKATWEILNILKEKKPQGGWDSLINQIIKLDILALPDASTIRDYMEATPGDDLIVEIASKYFYKTYAYVEPLYNSESIKEANALVQAIKILENEFDFQMLPVN